MAVGAGLLVVAGLGAGAMIFSDQIAEQWHSRDWLAPSAGWSALTENRSTTPARAALVERAATQSEADRGQPPAPEPAPVKAVILNPTTTSSIDRAPERMIQPASAAPAQAEAPPAQAVALTTPAVLTTAAAASETALAVLPLKALQQSAAPLPEVAATLKRARGLIERGDIAGARLLLERAAATNDARAIMVLAETYDPAMLSQWGARGIKGDPAKARHLYEKAAETGSIEARTRMLAFR